MRVAFGVAKLHDGRVLVAGGFTGPTWKKRSYVSSAALYDFKTERWSDTQPMKHARAGLSFTLLSDGRVLAAGGWAASGWELASAELFDPVTGIFTRTGDMVTAGAATAILLADGRVLLAHDSNGSLAAPAEIYDPVAGAWTATGPLAVARERHQATLLPNGKVLVAGGFRGTVTLVAVSGPLLVTVMV